MTSHMWQFEGTFYITGKYSHMGNGRPSSQSANAFQIQRSNGVEEPRPQSLYIVDLGT